MVYQERYKSCNIFHNWDFPTEGLHFHFTDSERVDIMKENVLMVRLGVLSGCVKNLTMNLETSMCLILYF